MAVLASVVSIRKAECAIERQDGEAVLLITVYGKGEDAFEQ